MRLYIKVGCRVLQLAGMLLLVSGAGCCMTPTAFGLGEGREYEMASPPFKGGYGAVLQAVAPDGESVAFTSLGVFAGIPRPAIGSTFLARRGGSGWFTTPAQPPFEETGVDDFSSDLLYVLGSRPFTVNEGDFVSHDLDIPDGPENWESFGGVILRPVEIQFLEAYELSASSDLCHLVVNGNNLLPEAPPESLVKLYDLARDCHGEGSSLRLVGVRNRLGPHAEPEEINGKCKVDLGAPIEGGVLKEQGAKFNAISRDGDEIFFTTAVDPACNDQQLFVRVSGSKTVEVSRPVDPSLPDGGCGESGLPGEVPGEAPCSGAAARMSSFFKGASEDGSRVFFTTEERLIAGSADTSNKLYMATIGCPAGEPECTSGEHRVTGMLEASTGQVGGESSNVRGVVSIAQDGSRVYFVAEGDLTNSPNDEGVAARKGADNLYVYDAGANTVSFVADLCSEAGRSGAVEDGRCPSGLANGNNDTELWRGAGEAQSSTGDGGDGRYLVFSSLGRLITHGPQTDTDEVRDVYLYDSVTGALDRVSVGVAGYDANGNNNEFDAQIEKMGIFPGQATVAAEYGLETRAMSDDGSRVVFSSAEPLSPDAINHHRNLYVWHKEPGWSEGRVSMISSGTSLTNDLDPVISEDGKNVFFTTSQGLIAADTENDLDVYDARIVDPGERFVEPAATRVQCSSDACQGAFTSPAPLLIPGSVSQAPGDEFRSVKTKVKVKKPGKSRKKRKTRKAPRKKKANHASSRSESGGGHR